MSVLGGFGRKLRMWFARDRFGRDLDDEVQAHIDLIADDYVRKGMSTSDACRRARREFGHVASLKEDVYDAWGTRALTDLGQDLKVGFRQIRSRPWFSAAAIAIMALSIGMNTTVFTLTNAMLFKPLPMKHGERIVMVVNQVLGGKHPRQGGEGAMEITYPDYLEFKEQNPSVEVLAAVSMASVSFGDFSGHAERVQVTYTTPDLFEIIDAHPIRGRAIEASDCQPSAEPVVVISYRFWQSRYSGNDDIVGRIIRLKGIPATIVGVMPEGILFPHGFDLWMPLSPPDEQLIDDRAVGWAGLIALLKPGATIQTASADFDLIAQRLAIAYPDTNENIGVALKSFSRVHLDRETIQLLLLMMGSVGFVLLIACSNVANMMLGKNLGRNFEFSIRASLGATRWQIVRLLLVEGILLSLLGGILGLGLAQLGVGMFDRITAGVSQRNYWVDFSFDYTVVGYFVALSLLSGILIGLMPALKGTRSNLNSSLSEGARASGGPGIGRLSGALVGFQFAATFVLLFGAGLLARSFVVTKQVNEFVPKDQIFSFRPDFRISGNDSYEDVNVRLDFYQEVVEKLKAIPGVTHAAAATALPGMGGRRFRVEFAGQPVLDPRDAPRAMLIEHTPGYLAAINVTILEGRGFNDFDGQGGQLVAMVTRKFAERHWPGRSALGGRFRASDYSDQWCTVIGVCSDIETRTGGGPPLVCVPHHPRGWVDGRFVVRSELDPSGLFNPIRSIIQEVDPDLPLYQVGTLKQLFERDFWYIGTFSGLFLIFAVVALILAAVGIYAIVAHSITQKTKEIAIRLALGATPGRVVRLMFAKGVRPLIVGLAIGVLLAPGTAYFIPDFLLIRVGYRDPMVLTTVLGILSVAGLVACWLPARKVARCQPATVLHRE